MKIKYNFGLLKNQMIGFLKESDGLGYHGNLKNVRKKGNNYHFVYEDCYIEISEEQFLTCKFVLKDNIYVIRQIKCGLIPQIKNDFLRYAEAL